VQVYSLRTSIFLRVSISAHAPGHRYIHRYARVFSRPFWGRSSYRHALSIGTQTAGTLLQRTTVGV